MSLHPFGKFVAGLFVAIAGLLTALVIAWFVFESGGRGYFSPDTLENFGQHQTLLIGYPVYRSPGEIYRSKLTTYLIDKAYWKPIAPAQPRWIEMFEWRSSWRDGESRLHKELAWYGESWIEWSDRHPDIARELWPCVLALLRSSGPYRYSAQPDSVAEALLTHGYDENGSHGFKTLADFRKRLKEVESEFGPIPRK